MGACGAEDALEVGEGQVIVAARTGVNRGLVALAVVWGFVVPVLGLTQGQLLPGDYHWVIKFVHLLVGVGAMGLGDGLAARIEQAPLRRR
jgi:hypothetical protein